MTNHIIPAIGVSIVKLQTLQTLQFKSMSLR